MMAFDEISTVLQLAASPAIIISACGLLLLTMSNRLGRAIDRSRILARERDAATGRGSVKVEAQLEILMRRCRLIRASILYASICILLTAILILLLFVFASAKVKAGWAIILCFGASICALILSLIYFIRDINQALRAVLKEVERDTP